MDVKESIKQTIEMFEKYDDQNYICQTMSVPFNKYDCVYPFTNEEIIEYYKKLNYDGKILSVASSGDHMLYSVLAGAKEITLFDINALTKYYVDLKVAAIKTLDLRDFKDYFMDRMLLCYPTLNYNIFKKFCNNLPPDSFEYWNALYENRKGKFRICDIDSLFNFVGNHFKICKYSKKETYEKLSILLKNVNLEFINTDIFELDKYLRTSYSTMIFSNISNYFDDQQIIKYLQYIKNELGKYLIYDGTVQYSYSFEGICKCKYEGIGFSDIDLENDSVGIYTKKRIK